MWGLRELGQHRAYPSAPACVLVRSRRWRLWSSRAILLHTYSRPSSRAAIRKRGRAASFPIPPTTSSVKAFMPVYSLRFAEKDSSVFFASVETGALMGCRQQSPSGPGTSRPHPRFSCKSEEKWRADERTRTAFLFTTSALFNRQRCRVRLLSIRSITSIIPYSERRSHAARLGNAAQLC